MRLADGVPAGHTDGFRHDALTSSRPPPITFVPGAGSKGSTGEPGDKRSWGTGGHRGTVWVRTNDMAHLRVLDCMVSHKWSRICDLYCAFNSQVCAAFLHLYCSVHEINCSVHVFLKCTVSPVKVSHCSADIHRSLFWPWQPSLCLISWKCLSDTKNIFVYSCNVGMQNWLHGDVWFHRALVTDLKVFCACFFYIIHFCFFCFSYHMHFMWIVRWLKKTNRYLH